MEIFNEASISVVTYHMLLFTDFVGNPEAQYLYGWQMNGIIILNLVINLIVVINVARK